MFFVTNDKWNQFSYILRVMLHDSFKILSEYDHMFLHELNGEYKNSSILNQIQEIKKDIWW